MVADLDYMAFELHRCKRLESVRSACASSSICTGRDLCIHATLRNTDDPCPEAGSRRSLLRISSLGYSSWMPDAAMDHTSPIVADSRSGPQFLDADRDALEAWLEFYRQTVLIKVGGLTAEQLCRCSVPPSTLSLIGLVRHLTMVERYWFGNIVAGVDLPKLYCESDPDGDFNDVRTATALDDLDRFHPEVETSRSRAANIRDLDGSLPGLRNGERLNLRWVYLHMIEEYARHLGHADLLRERIDGGTGY